MDYPWVSRRGKKVMLEFYKESDAKLWQEGFAKMQQANRTVG